MPNQPLKPDLLRSLKILKRDREFSTDSAIAKGTGLHHETVQQALSTRKASKNTEKSLETLVEKYAQRIQRLEHEHRWTRTVVPDGLHEQNMRASVFRQRLRDAFETDRSDHPVHAYFVVQTGGWLRPILRKILARPLTVDVYICHPGKTPKNVTGAARIPQVLSILEFFWNMPAALALQKNWESTLRVHTYDASDGCVARLAYFDEGTDSPGTLTARSVPTPRHHEAFLRGHPGYPDSGHGVEGEQFVDVHLSGNRDYKREIAQAKADVDRLPGCQPCLTWTQNGFEFVDKDDLHPARYLPPLQVNVLKKRKSVLP